MKRHPVLHDELSDAQCIHRLIQDDGIDLFAETWHFLPDAMFGRRGPVRRRQPDRVICFVDVRITLVDVPPSNEMMIRTGVHDVVELRGFIAHRRNGRVRMLIGKVVSIPVAIEVDDHARIEVLPDLLFAVR